MKNKVVAMNGLECASDGELIELAAKAAGICLHKNVKRDYGNWGCDTTCVDCRKDTHDFSWNPLHSVADRYELARTCGMALDFEESAVYYKVNDVIKVISFGFKESDARAIVRAAAEIAQAQE